MTKEIQTELLPCPFCGGSPTLVGQGKAPECFVYCSHCNLQSNFEETAIKRWNTRVSAPVAAPPLNLEALKRKQEWGQPGYNEAGVWNACIDHLASTGRLNPVPDGWQPIETAPEDGTPVLLAWKCTMKPFVYNNSKMPDWQMEIRPYCLHGSGGARSYHGEATHWQPLPLAPKPTGDV